MGPLANPAGAGPGDVLAVMTMPPSCRTCGTNKLALGEDRTRLGLICAYEVIFNKGRE